MSVRRVGILLECDGPAGGTWHDCPDGENISDAVSAQELRRRMRDERGWTVELPGGIDRCAKCSEQATRTTGLQAGGGGTGGESGG